LNHWDRSKVKTQGFPAAATSSPNVTISMTHKHSDRNFDFKQGKTSLINAAELFIVLALQNME
jgi:hypothetical protein